MKHRRIINDISLTRFINEIIKYAREQPNGVFTKPEAYDDERAENAFMFSISMEYSEKQ